MNDPMDIIGKHWHAQPVPIDTIIRECGVDICHEPLPDDVSGYIERQPGDGYKIVVNSTHPRTRQRFTAAHEFGHYIYHRDLLGEGVGDNRAYRAEGTDRPNPDIRPMHERQANSFAANLSMPRHVITKLVNQPTDPLAAKFGVSEEAMRIRMGR